MRFSQCKMDLLKSTEYLTFGIVSLRCAENGNTTWERGEKARGEEVRMRGYRGELTRG